MYLPWYIPYIFIYLHTSSYKVGDCVIYLHTMIYLRTVEFDLQVFKAVNPSCAPDNLHAVIDAKLPGDGNADTRAGARHKGHTSSKAVHRWSWSLWLMLGSTIQRLFILTKPYYLFFLGGGEFSRSNKMFTIVRNCLLTPASS